MTIRVGENIIAGAVTEFDKANTDMDNLTSQGQNIANWSNNVTNCITEIPQDIKLELKDGTLTLKTGSKVYVPNGSGVFDVVTVSSDINLSQSWGENADCLLFLYGGSILNIMPPSRCSSDTSDSISGADHFYYNTTNNTVRFIESSGSARSASVSLPIAIVKMSGSGANVSSVENIFNGFGYIGSTVFALPGVKGLIPNGRNADGTLKNIEFTIPSVITNQMASSYNSASLVYLNTGVFGLNYYKYDNSKNCLLHPTAGEAYDRLEVAIVSTSSGRITSFTPKTVFHATDYNDFENLNSNIQTQLNTKQDISNLSQTLDTSTAKYPSNAAVKAAIDAKDSLPSQSGNSGKFLTTNGSAASWGTVDLTSKANVSLNNINNSGKTVIKNVVDEKIKVVSELPSNIDEGTWYGIPE